MRIREVPERDQVAVEEAAETRDVWGEPVPEFRTQERIERRRAFGFSFMAITSRFGDASLFVWVLAAPHAIADQGWMKAENIAD